MTPFVKFLLLFGNCGTLASNICLSHCCWEQLEKEEMGVENRERKQDGWQRRSGFCDTIIGKKQEAKGK